MLFIFGRMRVVSWVWVIRIVWPCLVMTDIFCFVVGWIATWQDAGVTMLG